MRGLSVIAGSCVICAVFMSPVKQESDDDDNDNDNDNDDDETAGKHQSNSWLVRWLGPSMLSRNILAQFILFGKKQSHMMLVTSANLRCC